MRLNREHIALGVMPLSASLYLLLLWGVLPGREMGLDFYITLFTKVTIPSYISCFAVGLPILGLLRRLKILNIATILGIGVFGGMLVLVLYVYIIAPIIGMTFETNISIYTGLSWGAQFGALTALTFGIIADIPILGNADRST